MTKQGRQQRGGPRDDRELTIELHRIDRDAEVRMQRWKVASIGLIGLFTFLSIRELAGKQTLATVIVDALVGTGERGVSAWWILVAVAACAWAAAEHWLRLRKVASISWRVRTLEQLVDSERTSSGLTDAGQTPPIGR